MVDRKRTPDWTVARTIVFAPPAKPDKVDWVEFQVLVPVRAEYSNLGRNQASAPGGQRDKEAGSKVPWRIVAAQKLQNETGLVAHPDDLIALGRFENTTTNTEGKSFLTLTHAFLLELASHPERVFFDQNQNGMLWMNVVKGELQTQYRDENGEVVLEVTPAFNTRKMIEKALKMRKSMREGN